MSDYFLDNKSDEKLGRQSLRGGAILIAARALNVFLQIGSTFFLARLISPHDYGLVAMVSAIVGFAPMLIDLGMTDAAVQKHRITHVEVSAIFWLNVALGGGLALLVAIFSPLIAWFYHEPELQKIALVSSVTFLFSALSCQHCALLRRAMQFKRVALIDVGANLLSTVAAIWMALGGWGYWALVAKPILCTVFVATGVWWNCRWIPGMPALTPGVKEMLGFGIHVTCFTMTDYLGRSVDRIALGYRYGASQLGYFQNAMYVYDSLLGLVTQPLHSVAVSSLTKLRENIPELKRAWATALSSLSFFAMPAFGILAVTSQDVVALFLGRKWEPAGPLLGIFALRGVAHVVERTLGWLHVAAGRSDRWMRWGLVSSATQLVALFCGLPFGLTGVAITYAVAIYLLFVPALAYAGLPLGIGPVSVLKVVGPQMAAALCSAGFGYWVGQTFFVEMHRLARISLLVLVYSFSYLVIVVGVFRITKPLRVSASLLRDYIPDSVYRYATNIH
jgi:PST family polysaccharide transporter